MKTERPVTQVAEVDVKQASKKLVALPVLEAMGNESKVPPRIIIKKYTIAKIFVALSLFNIFTSFSKLYHLQGLKSITKKIFMITHSIFR